MRPVWLALSVLALAAVGLSAQTSVCIGAGRAGNLSGDPFGQWGPGWQAGLGLEHRVRGWQAVGAEASYLGFRPTAGLERPPWMAPAWLYVRLIHPRAILGTNLRLGGGFMMSHAGKAAGAVDEMAPQWHQILRASAGIRIPLTRRLGLAFDVGYLRTLDGEVALVPLTLGLCL